MQENFAAMQDNLVVKLTDHFNMKSKQQMAKNWPQGTSIFFLRKNYLAIKAVFFRFLIQV